jgi:hypothetical protein
MKVAEVSGCFQQRFDLLLAQDDRKLLLVPGQGNAFDGNLPVQRMGVEKPKSGDDLDVGGQGCALLLAQKQLVLTDVLRAKLVWRLPEMFGESGDALYNARSMAYGNHLSAAGIRPIIGA